MDIATKFASGQEAVEAIFRKDKQPQGRQKEDIPEASVQRGTKKKTRKKAQAKRNTVDADLVAAAEHRNSWKPPGGANVFDKMLKDSYPYHRGPVKHTLEECDMLQRYFNKTGPSAEGGKDQGNNKKGGDKEEEFPEVHNCFMIYGWQMANASARHHKQERRAVCSVKVATPVYLDWSDKPITFDQGDHPDCVPSPGRYPLVVDPVIGNARLSKVLMDGGISLNIIYAETLGLLGVNLSTIWAGAAPFHGIVPGKRVLPLGQHDLPVCFGTPSINKFSKWIEVRPLTSIGSEQAVAFFTNIIHRFGIPNSIITDNGTQFTGKKFLDFCEGHHIRVDWAVVAHPMTNGQVERANGMIL
jgi:hypothetical protein